MFRGLPPLTASLPEADNADVGHDADNDKHVSIKTTPNVQTLYLGGIFFLLLLAVFYVAASLILPIVLAIVLKLVLQPIVRVMEKIYLPRAVASLVVIVALVGSLYGLGAVLAAPASSWAQKIPSGISRIQSRMHTLTDPIKATQKIVQNAEGITQPNNTKAVTVAIQGTRLSDRLLNDTQSLLSTIGEMMLILFFLLASGDIFLRRFIEILPRFRNKRQAVMISQQIESDISAYLVTISFMNAMVGITTGIVATFFGLSDPILWGTLAFLLNYVPFLGPLIGITLLGMAGLLSENTLSSALMPATIYVLIHLTEGMVLTPMVLARRFTLNPVLVILAVIFWYWMWGVPGAVLSTPMLAIAKIIFDRVERLAPLGHFMEG